MTPSDRQRVPRHKGAFPCVTGVSCSPWPPCSASAAFVYAPFSPGLVAAQPAGRAAPRGLDVRPGDRQPLRDHPLDHRDRLHRHAGRAGLGGATGSPTIDAQGRPSAGQYFHGSQRLEVIWTIIPAAILVFIALYQMGTWAEHQVPQRRAQGPAAGRDHRPAVPVGDALPRARRQAATPPTTCIMVNDLHFVKNKTGADLPEVVRRAPLVLPAAAADQAGRRARA